MTNEPRGDWRALLRDARQAVLLTREQLAARSGVSAVSIKAYELGTRNPTRELLTVLLDALELDRYGRNQVLEAAGFRPDGLDVWKRNPDFALSFDEAVAEVQRYRWPAFLTGEGMKLLAANAAYQRLFGRQPEAAQAQGVEGSFLTWMSHPVIARLVKNWDEVMTFMIGELKGSLRFPEATPEGSSTYVNAAMERFFKGDPAYINRYLKLWDTTPASKAKSRFSYRVVIDHPLIGELDFRCIGMGVNEVDGLVINDWLPQDSGTWERLEGAGVVG